MTDIEPATATRDKPISESPAFTVALFFIFVAAQLAAAMWFGPTALAVVFALAADGLIMSRLFVFERIDEARADADDAVRDGHVTAERVTKLKGEVSQAHERIGSLEAEVDALRDWIHAFRDAYNDEMEAETEAYDPAPTTQPIVMPAPRGPVTAPAAEVAAVQVRQLMDAEPVVDLWRAQFDFSGGRQR